LAIDHNRENNVHPLPSATTALDEPVGKKRQSKTLSKKRIALLALVPLLALAAAGAWIKFHPRANPAARFVTATVSQGDIEDTVTALGNLQPKTYVDVGAQVSGQLMKINVTVGQKVKRGDLLAEIDPTLAEAKVNADDAALANLQAQLVDRRAQLDLAQKQLGRQQGMMKDNATSEDALQVAATTVRSNKAQIAALEAQAKQAQSTLSADQTSLGYTKIYAPMTGTVVSLTAQQGQTLNATQTTPVILRIADLATMTVWTQVSEADVPRLKVGMDAYFTTLGNQSQRWRGKLLQILPTPDVVNNVVLYPALFEVSNADSQLMTQMSAQVFFVVASVKNAVTVPVAALHKPGSHDGKGEIDPDMADPGAGATGDSPASAGTSGNAAIVKPYLVRVLDANGHATKRTVWIGVSNRVSAEVLEGLAPGDVVVVGRQNNTETAEATSGGAKGSRTGIGRLF
jgi:membrane fusion protein, macrolide-specific efflux system